MNNDKNNQQGVGTHSPVTTEKYIKISIKSRQTVVTGEEKKWNFIVRVRVWNLIPTWSVSLARSA